MRHRIDTGRFATSLFLCIPAIGSATKSGWALLEVIAAFCCVELTSGNSRRAKGECTQEAFYDPNMAL